MRFEPPSKEIFKEMVGEGVEEGKEEGEEGLEEEGDESEGEEHDDSDGLFDELSEVGNFDHAAGVVEATTARPIRHRESVKDTEANHKEDLKTWLRDHDLLLGNGETASSLLKSDSKVLSKLLELLKTSRLEIIRNRAAQIDQVEAEEALSKVGIEGLFDLLARAVLDGKYPLTHGVWKRIIDMLENM